MEKNEHAILLDIPSGGKNGKYHSAVLTTYAIDLIHFDNQLLNTLHRKQICSINVFADTNQMDKSKFELRKSIDAIDQVIKSLING